MKKYQFVQPVYHYYEVEAKSEQEAWEKTQDLKEVDCYDVVVGEWLDATPEEITQ